MGMGIKDITGIMGMGIIRSNPTERGVGVMIPRREGDE